MRKVDLFETIRRDHLVRGQSIRHIARTLRVSRRTIRTALLSATPPERKAAVRRSPVLGSAKPFIEMVLEGDRKAPRKQRHTAHRIWERLRTEQGLAISESTVRKYVGRRKRELFGVEEAMVPQVKEPGAEAEVDFFEASVDLAGERTKVDFFQMRACYSGRIYVRPLARLTQQAFLESMVLAFEYFGGVFGLVRMDNHSLAVENILRGRQRVERDRFVALRSQYLFEGRFCRLGIVGAHEKGGVEGGQGHFRRNHLVPVPRCGGLDELASLLLDACARDDARVSEGRTESKQEAWRYEVAKLRPLPEERFDTVEHLEAIRVDEKSRVTVKRVRYSVPSRFAGRLVRAELSSDLVLVFGDGEQIARWPRCWQVGSERLELDHYLEVLKFKPQALRRSLPLRQAEQEGRWPIAYERMFSELTTRLGESAAARQMVDVLLLHRRYPAQTVHDAVAGALAAGAVDGRAVAVLVRRSLEGQRPLTVLDVGALDEYQRDQPSVDAYDQLLAEGRR